ncbi:MAG TPA: DUF5666 domain-containing protein [Terriglobales bacterium]|nr:DUF5666 domain-containing protein [Terriglobales bacterium]
MKLGLRTFTTLLVLAGTIALTSCSGGNGGHSMQPAPATPQSAMVTVNIGDAPNDRVAALELTIASISLTNSSGTTVPVLTSPMHIELRRLAGTFRPIALSSVPAGTYTQANLQLSAAEITVLDPATGRLVEKNLPVPSTPVSIKFASPLILSAQVATVNLDFNLASSVSIDAAGNITFTPIIVATTGMVRPDKENQHEVEEGEVEEVVGAVTNVASPAFTIMLGPGPQTLTFTTNSSTEFKGVGSLSAITKGTIVEVHAVTQSDGTLLATKVEVEMEDENELEAEAEGLVVSTTGTPVTQFAILVRDHSGDSGKSSPIGTTLTVNVNSNTKFNIDADEVDLTNLNFTPAFDANSLAKGQNVEAEMGSHEFETEDEHSGGMAITADRVRLKQQALTGTVSALAQNGTASTFTLTVAADSVFAMLSGQTTVTVFVQPSTEVRTTPANGATVQVRGLLFFASGKYNLVAHRIGQP